MKHNRRGGTKRPESSVIKNRHVVFIAVMTVSAIFVLSLFVGLTIRSVNRKVTEYSFAQIERTTKQLAHQLYDTADMDRTILTAIAAGIADDQNADDAEICRIMQAYSVSSSYVSWVELLRPDGTLLCFDGTVTDVSGVLDFSGEAARSPFISDREASVLHPLRQVIRNAVPVTKDGETVGVLYGVIRLSDLAERFKTDIYDGHAYVYLVDGATGDFLLDTWHRSLGNISDFQGRTTLPGYSFQTAIGNMKSGVGGDLGFVSKTTGGALYLHYEPVGTNRWNVAVSVEEEYALAESSSVSESLYRMAAVITAVMVLYVTCVSGYLIRAYLHVRRLGIRDQTTGLLNRNAYEFYLGDSRERTFESIVCIYADANGLHELNNRCGHAAGDQMLCTIARALLNEFDAQCVYRVGGDEFAVFQEGQTRDAACAAMERAMDEIESHGYTVSCGIVCRTEETGLDGITQAADNQMLENKSRYYAGHDRRSSR